MKTMKMTVIILSTMTLTGLLSFSHAGATSEGPLVPDSAAMEVPLTVVPPALQSTAAGEAPSAGFEPAMAGAFFRDLPSINGRYSVGGTMVMPYLGAGFGSGYTSELDRSLRGGSSLQTDPGLRSLLGPNITPNEFQMGIRIPF